MVCVELSAEMLHELVDHALSVEACDRLIGWYDYEYVDYGSESDGNVIVDPECIKSQWKEYMSPRHALQALENDPRFGLFVKDKLYGKMLKSDIEKLDYLHENGMTILTRCLNGHVLVLE